MIMNRINDFVKFRLLVWKYICYRRYFWILTVAEVVLPVVLVFIAIKVSFASYDGSTKKHDISTFIEKTYDSLICEVPFNTLCYLPANDEVGILMKKLKLFLEEKTKRNITVIGASSETDLASRISSSIDNKCAGIIYHNIDESDFSYTIRLRDISNIDKFATSAEINSNGPHYTEGNDEYLTSGFVNLQASIDYQFVVNQSEINETEFLESRFQPFPYPDYESIPIKFDLIVPSLILTMIVISFLLTCPLILIIHYELDEGINDMMKMLGVNEKYIWLCWYLNTVLIDIIVCSLLTIVFFTGFEPPGISVIRSINPFLLWTVIILYFIAELSTCFLFCRLFQSKWHTLTMHFVVTSAVAFVAMEAYSSRLKSLIFLTCFFPVGNFVQILHRIFYLEMLEIPVSWNNMFKNEDNAVDSSVGTGIFLQLFNIVFYLLLKFGIMKLIRKFTSDPESRHLFDVFGKPERKRKSRRVPSNVNLMEETSKKLADSNKPEQIYPEEIMVTVHELKHSIVSAHKIDKADFSILRNEIFAILGHEKSGKTKILKSLTGLTKLPNLSVRFQYNWESSETNNNYVRIGYCPQNYCFIPYFSIKEHIIFYSKLKGIDENITKKKVCEYLKQLGEEYILNNLDIRVPPKLKRKLSIILSVIGDFDILFLDEPTTNLDNHTSCQIWNFLTEIRGDNTIVFTTSDIEEAVSRANRVSIVHNKKILSSGTSAALKEAFESHCELKVKPGNQMLKSLCWREDNLIRLITLIKNEVPRTRASILPSSRIVFFMPNVRNTPKVSSVIEKLHNFRTLFDFRSLSLSNLSMKEAYLKMRLRDQNSDGTRSYELEMNADLEEFIKMAEGRGRGHFIMREIKHHQVLFMKKFDYIRKNWFDLFYRVIVATIVLPVLLWWITTRKDILDYPKCISLNLYSNQDIIVKTFNSVFSKMFIQYAKSRNINVIEIDDEYDLSTEILQYARDNIADFRRDLILAASLNVTITTSVENTLTMYNGFIFHSLPVAINSFNNVFLKSINKNAQISVINHPVQRMNATTLKNDFITNPGAHSPVLIVWYITLVFFTIDLLQITLNQTAEEREKGLKENGFLKDIPWYTYWINRFIFDFLIFIIILAIRILLCKFFDHYEFFTLKRGFGVAVLLFTLFFISGLIFVYLLSVVLQSKYLYFTYWIFLPINVLISMTSYIYYVNELELLKFPTQKLRFAHLVVFLWRTFNRLIPPLNFSVSFIKYIMIWRINHLYEVYLQVGLDHKPKHDSSGDQKYFERMDSGNPNAMLMDIIFFGIDFFIYLVLLLSFVYVSKKNTIVSPAVYIGGN